METLEESMFPKLSLQLFEELEKVYSKVKKDKYFQKEVIKDLNDFVGRPSPFILLKDGLKNLVEQKFI